MEAAEKSSFKLKFSSAAFGRGLAIVALIYGVLVLWIYLNDEDTALLKHSQLASQTINIEWKTPEPPAGTEEHPTEAMGPFPQTLGPPAEPAVAAPAVMESGLAAAPVEGLFDDGTLGHMPKVRKADGLTAFKAYRRPFDVHATEEPLIALAIVGLGLSESATETAVKQMPPDVSFVLSPYANNPEFWVTESRSRGHEIWFTLPMESSQYPALDPGPQTMLIGAPERENRTKMDWLMTRADGYVGFVTSYQPEFMNSVNDMRPVVAGVYNRGLAFVDGSTSPGLVPQTMAVSMKVPYSVVDLWIDRPDSTQQSIDANLAQLETLARDKGFAVGVIQALPISYQEVLKWLDTLPAKGLRLAPLSATTGY